MIYTSQDLHESPAKSILYEYFQTNMNLAPTQNYSVSL